jgi:hypothetical protein
MPDGNVGYFRGDLLTKKNFTVAELIGYHNATIKALRSMGIHPDWIKVDTLTNRENAGYTSRAFFATDTGQLFLDNGTSWVELTRFTGPAFFGDYDGGDYSTFEADGTLKFVGAATIHDDIPPVPLLTSKIGAAAPTLANFAGATVKQYTFAVNDIVYGASELVHDYKEDSDIEAHIHWANNGTEGSAKYVKWQLDYTISNASAAFSTTPTSLTVEVEIPASTADRYHFVSQLGSDITGTGLDIGAYIVWSLKRITATGTAPAANPFGLAVGFHIEKDTCGSRTRYGK